MWTTDTFLQNLARFSALKGQVWYWESRVDFKNKSFDLKKNYMLNDRTLLVSIQGYRCRI